MSEHPPHADRDGTAAPQSRLTIDVLTSVLGLVGTRAIGFVAGVFLRAYAPSDRGVFALAALASLGVGTAATGGAEYWVARETARGIAQSRVARMTGRRVVMASSAILVSALLIAATNAVRVDHRALAAAAAWAIANVVSMLLLAQLGGRRDLRRVAIAQIISSLAFATALLGLLILGRSEVWMVLSAASMSAVLLGIVSYRPYSLSIARPEVADLGDARAIGVPAMLGEVAGLFAGRASLLLIAALLSSDDVGLFVVAASIADVLLVIPNGISQVLLPQVAADGHGRSTGPLVALNVAFGLMGVSAIYLFGKFWLADLFGQRYGQSTAPLLWLSVASVATGTWKLLLSDLAARGNTSVRIRTSALAGAVVISLDLVLLEPYGLRGAATATLVASLAALALACAEWTRGADRRVSDLFQLALGLRLARKAAYGAFR